MIWGLSGAPCDPSKPYADAIEAAAEYTGFPPKWLYAIAWQETIVLQVAGVWNAATIVSGDGGHGLFQLTSSYPVNWQDPYTNAVYAVEGDPMFLRGAAKYWFGRGYRGRELVKLASATFNAGLKNVLAGHADGDADEWDTNKYGQRIVNSLDAIGFFA